MLWLIVLVILIGSLLLWLLISPIYLVLDTRIPVVTLRWAGLGLATLMYAEEDWWVRVRFWFFKRSWSLTKTMFAEKNRKSESTKRDKNRRLKKSPARRRLTARKMADLMLTFKVEQLKLAYCSSDYSENGRWYFLNLIPPFNKHLFINFSDENFLLLKIRNNGWRIAGAFFKQ